MPKLESMHQGGGFRQDSGLVENKAAQASSQDHQAVHPHLEDDEPGAEIIF